MLSRKLIKEAVSIFEKLGVQIDAIETGGKHIKFWVSRGESKKLFTRSNTDSDHRAVLNFKGDVRRWFKQTGETNGHDTI